jgi:hypothetical protein
MTVQTPLPHLCSTNAEYLLRAVLLAIALLFAILLSTSCLVGEHFGLGKHIWNLTTALPDLPLFIGRITKSLYGAYLAYSTSITFTKLSIISFYLRVFPRSHSSPDYFFLSLYVAMFFMISLWVCSIFTIIFTCVPVSAAWDYSIVGARCIPIWRFFYVSSAFKIATDLVLCISPLPMLWSLHMPKAQKIVVCGLFSIGLLYLFFYV